MNNNVFLNLILTVLVLAIGVGAYFYFQPDWQISQPQVSPTIIPSPKITSAPSPMPTRVLPEDWEIYTSQQHEFQIAHPPEMEASVSPNEGVRLLLTGPSQSQGTEVTDGILLIINSGAYEQENLETIVENQADELVHDPVTESVSEIRQVEVSGLSGYSFDTVGFGESTYYYLNRAENQYLRIIKIVQDPTNQGFEDTVNQILATLTLI